METFVVSERSMCEFLCFVGVINIHKVEKQATCRKHIARNTHSRVTCDLTRSHVVVTALCVGIVSPLAEEAVVRIVIVVPFQLLMIVIILDAVSV